MVYMILCFINYSCTINNYSLKQLSNKFHDEHESRFSFFHIHVYNVQIFYLYYNIIHSIYLIAPIPAALTFLPWSSSISEIIHVCDVKSLKTMSLNIFEWLPWVRNSKLKRPCTRLIK